MIRSAGRTSVKTAKGQIGAGLRGSASILALGAMFTGTAAWAQPAQPADSAAQPADSAAQPAASVPSQLAGGGEGVSAHVCRFWHAESDGCMDPDLEGLE